MNPQVCQDGSDQAPKAGGKVKERKAINDTLMLQSTQSEKESENLATLDIRLFQIICALELKRLLFFLTDEPLVNKKTKSCCFLLKIHWKA